MTIYRKIWTDHFGPIPKDETGRSYEIHHIDGNHSNNHIDNLKCITIQEHYQIHYSQGDWGACSQMAKRMKLSSKELSELASLNNIQRVKKGNNPFVGPEINRKRIENGTHHLLGGKIQRKSAIEQSKKGTHPFQIQMKEGRHSSQIEWKCEHCGKVGKNLANYSRFHGNNCKNKKG